MKSKKVTIEFFHDVICSWCYILSPRLRKLVKEIPEVEVIHHSFALSKSPEHTIRMFGSMENAKKEIMDHWRASNINDDNNRINADLMESRNFDYPHSLPGLLGCKAAELQGGQKVHWDYFDLVQKAHLTEARNIADLEVLYDIASKVGLNKEKFINDYNSKIVMKMVEDDIKLSKQKRINSVPTLIINSEQKISGALKYNDLKELIIKNY
ncbi:DsbA family oxidoreductase [Tepidibacter hydrothermalis]|uniref:DsbA family protein n=1 Tax=Tepidibacter hydrothermalis TaxID=3036126 RepID=A0ABY8E9V3_9FIRM|nr:DsbA family protein [Tepidibacter hydrothermalis]WFD09669.1 DsbA family protein [Tepidibacter hydrothermalis]